MPQRSKSSQLAIPTLVQKVVSVSLILAIEGIGSTAQAKPDLEYSTAPLNLSMVQNGLCAPNTPGVTDKSISQTEVADPSLWWIRDQIAAQEKFTSKLIDRWIACKEGEGQRVDVLVNSQIWSLFSLFDRYEFINRFGTVASEQGYNLRVFDRQGTILAAYTCNYEPVNVASKQTKVTLKPQACELFDSLAKTNFWSPTKSPDGLFPTENGTDR